MNNKMLVLIATLLFLGSNAYAQDQKTSFGVRGGVNFQNITGKDFNGDDLDFGLITGFHLGVSANIPFAPAFYFQPGLLYTTKGGKTESDFLGIASSLAYNLSYLEVPLNFLYRPALGNGHLILGFGPYIGYGISGRSRYTISSVSTERDIDFTSEYEGLYDSDKIRPFDFGANLFFGYEFAIGVVVQINTQLGLTEINPNNTTLSNDQSSFKNTGFGLSVGYQF